MPPMKIAFRCVFVHLMMWRGGGGGGKKSYNLDRI